jgi:ferredoxin
MAHIVTQNCVDCKFTDCVEVCPVDAFFELDNQVIIDPDECIDCSACVGECPVEAIFADDEVPEEFEQDIAFNAEEAAKLRDQGTEPITEKKDPLPTAEAKAARLKA